MTRQVDRTPRRRPSSGIPSRLPSGLPVAPVLSAAGLLLVAIVTLNLVNGQLPFPGGGGGPVARTPTPSGVVVVPEDPRSNVPGTIVYVKDGNVWRQSGKEATQLTSGGRDAMPSITPDGGSVLFVRYRDERGRWVAAGRERNYDLTIPSLMRVPLAGGEPEVLLDGRVTSRSRTWFGWIRQPVMSPDGKTIALLTDLPDPTRSNVTLHLYDLETEKLRALDLPETVPLGHQDPEWRPDGKVLLYVRNARDGARGTPRLYRLNPESGNARAATNPGYLHPSYSPDGRFIAATRTSAFGTNIVILDASNGAELLRVTTDDRSWAPAWSPRGDAIAFLHMQGQVVDLRMVELIGTGPGWTAGESLELTQLSGLDSISRPDWFIPADQLPPPTPEPTGPAESPAASPAGS